MRLAEIGSVGILALFGAVALVILIARRRHRSPRTSPLVEAPPVAADVRALLDRLFDPDPREDAAAALEARGAEVVPDLIASLADRGARWRADVVAVLGRIGDSRARPVIEGIAIRSERSAPVALGALAEAGFVESLPLILAPLATVTVPTTWNDWLPHRAAVYEGIVQAAARGRITPAFRDALVAPLAERVGDRPPGAATGLLALDRDAAAVVLLSPDVLGRGPNAVGESLYALFTAGVAVDPALAMSLADALPHRAVETDAEAATLTAVLRTLARSGHPDARTRIEAYAAFEDERTRLAARDALLALAGVEDAAAFVAARVEEAGLDALTPAQRTWHLAWSYLACPDHDAWLASDAADHAAATVAALREIGAGDAADVLAEACGRFEGGMPSGADARRARLERATAGDASPFADLDVRRFDLAPAAEERLFDFAIAHAEHFRSPSRGQPVN